MGHPEGTPEGSSNVLPHSKPYVELTCEDSSLSL